MTSCAILPVAPGRRATPCHSAISGSVTATHSLTPPCGRGGARPKMCAFQVCTQQTVQQPLTLGQSVPKADQKVAKPLLKTEIQTNSHVAETKHTTVVRPGGFRRSGEGNSLPLHLFASFPPPPPPLLHCSFGQVKTLHLLRQDSPETPRFMDSPLRSVPPAPLTPPEPV